MKTNTTLAMIGLPSSPSFRRKAPQAELPREVCRRHTDIAIDALAIASVSMSLSDSSTTIKPPTQQIPDAAKIESLVFQHEFVGGARQARSRQLGHPAAGERRLVSICHGCLGMQVTFSKDVSFPSRWSGSRRGDQTRRLSSARAAVPR